MTNAANDLRPPPAIEWGTKPNIQTAPYHHFCSVLERGDIEEKLHSSTIDVFTSGMKLDGVRNKSRLCEVLAIGPGRWVRGGRQPAEVAPGQFVYVRERTVPFRLLLRKQNHFFVAMDAIMAELDRENVRLRPVGQFVVTREVEDRARVAIMGDLPFHVAKTFGVDKKGGEADDVGCLKTRFEEVVAVGPGRFGGYVQRIEDNPDYDAWLQTPPGKRDAAPCPWRLITEPYWETPDCKPGDLIVFSDLARPTEITLAGRKYTLFEFDHSICAVLDGAV